MTKEFDICGDLGFIFSFYLFSGSCRTLRFSSDSHRQVFKFTLTIRYRYWSHFSTHQPARSATDMAFQHTTDYAAYLRPPHIRFYEQHQPGTYDPTAPISHRRRNTISTNGMHNRLLLCNRNECPPIIKDGRNHNFSRQYRGNANRSQVLYVPVDGPIQSDEEEITIDNDAEEINLTNLGPFIKLSVPAQVTREDNLPRQARIRITYE